MKVLVRHALTVVIWSPIQLILFKISIGVLEIVSSSKVISSGPSSLLMAFSSLGLYGKTSTFYSYKAFSMGFGSFISIFLICIHHKQVVRFKNKKIERWDYLPIRRWWLPSRLRSMRRRWSAVERYFLRNILNHSY